VSGIDSVVSTAPNHPSLVTRKIEGTPKRRKFVVIDGVAPPLAFSVFNDDLNALEKAVKERVFFVKNENGDFVEPPRPVDKEFFFSRLLRFTSLLSDHLPSTVPITRQEFVDTYSGRKRVVYQKACDSLDVFPLREKDSYIKTFLKFEKTNFTSKIPVPRVISPRDPRFNIEIGRFIRPIEERIFKSIGKVMGRDTVMKGLNSAQVATAIRRKWDSFKRPVALGMDASRFDQHVSKEALQWEHSIYEKCFWRKPDREQLSSLTHQQLANKCFGRVGDGEVKFTTNGVRASGDMNTSLGACLIMCAMVFSFAAECAIKIELVNNGDDCVVIMEKENLHKFSARAPRWFKEMGFTMVIEDPVFVFESISFCQAQPVYSGPGPFDYIMVRDPRIAISKDATCMHPYHRPKEFLGWVKAVGTGGIALAGGMPVWQSFYNMYLRSSSSSKAHDLREVWGWGVRRMAYGCARQESPILEYSRASYYWAFGVSPEEQVCIEKLYDEKMILAFNDVNVPRSLTLPL
jgi:hypothetical protein